MYIYIYTYIYSCINLLQCVVAAELAEKKLRKKAAVAYASIPMLRQYARTRRDRCVKSPLYMSFSLVLTVHKHTHVSFYFRDLAFDLSVFWLIVVPASRLDGWPGYSEFIHGHSAFPRLEHARKPCLLFGLMPGCVPILFRWPVA